eukprot:215833-Chlamydomonas_euryale.AAC.2
MADGPPGPPPKRARAFLAAFPDAASAARGPAALQPELLVGFDPVRQLVRRLAERYGHLADFAADAYGGRCVGVRWRAEAFLPVPPRSAAAHGVLPCVLTTTAARSAAPPACVPNIVQVLAEMADIGEGLVCDVVAAPSCRRMA